MATLQQIRNRGGLLVSIVIGLALLAFIIGDALSSGASLLQGDRNRVGRIASDNISIRDFQNRLSKNEEMVKLMNNGASLTSEQQEMLRENTWQQLVMENIMGLQYAELGIAVSSEELYDMLLGDNMDANVRRLFADPTTGQVDVEQAKQVIKQLVAAPDGTPQKSYWLNLEKEVSEAKAMNKFNTLIAKGMFVTDAEVESQATATTQISDISYIVRPYSTVSDSLVSISNNEIQQYYKEHANLFKQTSNRQIMYVNFDVEPSVQDYAETERIVSNLKDEFAETQDILEFVELSSDGKHNSNYLRKDEIGNDSLANFIFSSDKVYGPYLENKAYKLARRADMRMLPDSVRARHILLPPTANADSLINLINKGANFETIAKDNSIDQNSAVNGGDLGWFSQNMMVQPFSDSAFFAPKGKLIKVNTQYGTHIIQVTDRSVPVQKVQMAIIEKEVIPSTTTTNQVYNTARTFAQSVNNIEQFNAKVAEMNLNKRMATINKNDKSIAGINDSREMIRQAFLAQEEGSVLTTNDKSTLFETPDKFTFAIVTSINQDGIAPLNKVTGQIRTILTRQKKAEILNKEFDAAKQGSESLLSVAQKMGVEVKDATDISFSSFQIPGAGIEPKLISAVDAQKEGAISSPVDGNQGVYLFQIDARRTEEVTPDLLASVRQRIQQMNGYSAAYQAIQALNENANVIDERYKFY